MMDRIMQYMSDPTITEIKVVGRKIMVMRNKKLEIVAQLASSVAISDLAAFICKAFGDDYAASEPLHTYYWPNGAARTNIVHESVTGGMGPIITIRKVALATASPAHAAE